MGSAGCSVVVVVWWYIVVVSVGGVVVDVDCYVMVVEVDDGDVRYVSS